MSTERPSKIAATVDLDSDGKRFGALVVPHSRNDSAWGSIRIPIAVIRNGDGPCALLVAGNHGDECEGQVALRDLARTLDPSEVTGTVLVLPGLNYPAVRAATRCSPIDGGNMNRSFPGRADGTVTQMIAHYVATVLVPRADLVLDLHYVGKTLDFVPFAATHRLPDKALEARAIAAVRAFGAPVGVVMLELDAEGMLDTWVEGLGKLFVTTELAGGGSSTVRSNRVAATGVRNDLNPMGVLACDPEIAAPSRMVDMPDERCFVAAERNGIHEPLADLGDEVEEGQPVARIHSMDDPSHEPAVYVARRSGLLIGRHFPGLVQSGDFLASVALDL